MVSVATGCLEVPCEYKTFQHRRGLDTIDGRFESTRTHRRIDWEVYDTGFWWFVHRDDIVIWRRPALHGWHLWFHERINFLGQQYYLVTNGSFHLMSLAESPTVLSELATLASSYRADEKNAECEQPQSWLP